MPFEELPHTADIKVRVWAGTLEELFAEAAKTMNRLMFGQCAGEIIEEELTLEAEDREALMHDFLSEVLFLNEVKGLVCCSVEVQLGEKGLRATLRGEPFDPQRHRVGPEIKGISYHGLRIYKEGDDHVLEVIFDI